MHYTPGKYMVLYPAVIALCIDLVLDPHDSLVKPLKTQLIVLKGLVSVDDKSAMPGH